MLSSYIRLSVQGSFFISKIFTHFLKFSILLYVFRKFHSYLFMWYDVIYLTATGLTPGDSSTVHIYTQTLHRTTQIKIHRTTHYRRKTIHRTKQVTN
jgi:hypothetical protein